MPTPEELARINTDKQLEACGWIVQSRREMNLFAAHDYVADHNTLDHERLETTCAIKPFTAGRS